MCQLVKYHCFITWHRFLFYAAALWSGLAVFGHALSLGFLDCGGLGILHIIRVAIVGHENGTRP